jgi:hypothetical protein
MTCARPIFRLRPCDQNGAASYRRLAARARRVTNESFVAASGRTLKNGPKIKVFIDFVEQSNKSATPPWRDRNGSSAVGVTTGDAV